MRCRISLKRLNISLAFASRCKFRIPFITRLLLALYFFAFKTKNSSRVTDMDFLINLVVNRKKNKLVMTVTLSF